MKWLKTRKQRWLVPVYMIFYVISFSLLERHVTADFHLITSPLDKYIPFCELFVVPYYLWFFYITAVLVYFIFYNESVREYNQLIFSLGIGMTLFLFISFVYPNGLNLRPAEFPRDNFFTGWVGSLYRTDTPTNVFPSIHVYNSVVACIAVRRCESLRKRRGIQISSFVLSVLIILSTVFLKQHSVSDVISAFVLNFVVYAVIYRPDWLFSRSKKKIADAEKEMPVN